MSLKELEATLPNGFHDSLLHRWEWDLETQVVVFEMSIWTGDLRSQDDADRERHVRQRLVLRGVQFVHWEAPHPGYPYARARPVRVDLSDLDRGHPLFRELPPGTFGARFFVEEWNAFVSLAAEHAELIAPASGEA